MAGKAGQPPSCAQQKQPVVVIFTKAGELRRIKVAELVSVPPVDPAYPSATDARNAFYPDSVFLICSLLQPDQPVIRGYLLIQEELAEQPAGLTPVRGNPHFLARHHAGPPNPCYDLITTEDDGSERWQQVQIVKQEIIIAQSAQS